MSIKTQLDALFGPGEYFDEEGAGSFGIPEYKRPQTGALPDASDLETGTTDELAAPTIDRSIRAKETGGMDRTRVLASGIPQVGEMVVGGLEYVARQNKFLRPTVAPALEGVRGSISEFREGILSGVSDEYLDKIGREILTLDPEKTIWQGGPLEAADAIYGKFLQSLPATLAVMLPAGRLFRAGNTRGALTYLGASEGGMSVGSIANNITDEIKAMTHEELIQESEAYRRTYEKVGGDEELARQEFTAQAQGAAPLVGGLAVASISLVTGRLLKPVFEAGGDMGLGRRAAQGFLAEFPQEGSQGASEQLVQNFAAKIYDEDRNLSEGVAEAFAQEGLVGGLTGGAVAGAFGQRPQRPLPPAQEGPGGQFGLPGIGPQQEQAIPDAPVEDPGLRTEDPMEMGQRVGQLPLSGGLDLDPRSGRDLSTSTEGVLVPDAPVEGPAGEQAVLPLGDPRPLAERGPGQRTITEVDEPLPTQLPDQLDQPTAEPIGDIQAQLEDMNTKGGRVAVYLSPEQRDAPRSVPKGARVLPNFDGKGGTLIVKSASVGNRANRLRSEVTEGTKTMQEVIGELTLAGTGKPVDGRYVVQLKDDAGNVARESMVETRSEALKLKKKWGAGAVITTPEAAVTRRAGLDTGVVPPGDPEAIAERTAHIEDVIAEEKQAQADRTFAEQQGKYKFEEAAAEPFDADISDEDITALSRFEVTYPVASERTLPNKTTEYVEESKKQEFDTQEEAEAFATQAGNKARSLAISFGAQHTKPSIKMLTTEELDVTFERAVRAKGGRKATTAPTGEVDVQAKAGPVRFVKGDKAKFERDVKSYEARRRDKKERRQTAASEKGAATFDIEQQESYEASTTQTTVEREAREIYGKTPGKKLKFIRRERGAQIRRQAEIRDVSGTEVVVKQKPGKVTGGQKVSTKPLTYESVPAEESKEAKVKRLARVKEANTRLRLARNRAKRFRDRFDTTGPFGTFIAEWTNVDNTLTDKARDFILARDTYFSLLELAESILTSGVKSSAHAKMAKSVSVALERIKLQGMTPEKFAAEFSAVARSTEYEFNKTVPAGYREELGAKRGKILKSNSERRRSIIRRSQFEALGNNSIFRDIVNPILRKFHDAALERVMYPDREVRYTPTEFEMEQLKFAMRNFRFEERYDPNIFFTPLRKELTYLGFRFDKKGNLDVKSFEPTIFEVETDKTQTRADIAGRHERAPEFVGPRKLPDEALRSKVTGVYTPTAETKKRDPVKVRAAMDVADKYQAVEDIKTANALLEKFKEMVRSAKTTVNGLKRQEQRFIRGLRKISAWQDTSPGMGRIYLGGWKSKTYRLVGPRLDARTIKKGDARAFIQRIAKIPMPRELLPFARRVTDTTKIDEFVESNLRDFFLEKVDVSDPQYQTAASAVGDLLLDRNTRVDANTILEVLAENLPKDSFYAPIVEQLRNLNMGEVTLEYDYAGVKFEEGSTSMGKYDPNTGRAYLNQSQLAGDGSGVLGAKAVHTIVHEFAHAATQNAINDNLGLATYYSDLRNIALAEWNKQNPGQPVPYGLRTTVKGRVIPIDEFIAEIYSDETLQNFARSIKLEKGKTLWSRIVDGLRNLLGFTDTSEINTLLDAVLTTESVLFEGAGLTREGADLMKHERMDTVVQSIASKFTDKFTGTSGILSRVREKGSAALHNLMTMEQFVERYGGQFVVDGVDQMKQYFNAFRGRNAKAAEYMQIPQEISGRWTELEVADSASALAISQIGTEASLHRIAADKPLTDEANEHLSDDLHDMHKELHDRYVELPQAAKDIYQEVTKYYNDSLKRETLYLMQSALRGVLGKEISVTDLEKLETKEDLTELLKEDINETDLRDMVDTIYKMAMLPRQRSGNYFPSMRYGDNVAYAQKQWEDEIFEDRKAANGASAERLASDPTLDVQVFENDDGKFVFRTFERAFVMGESVAEVDRLKAKLMESGNFTEEDFYDTQKLGKTEREAAITSNKALGKILATLEGNKAAQSAIKDFYLRSLADSSFRKHEVKRKNRLGVDYDLQHRNLATYAKQASYYTAQLEFGWRMQESLSNMVDYHRRRRGGPGDKFTTMQLSEATEHLKFRDQMGHELPSFSKFIRGSVEFTHFFMLTSPSYWAINATQPWLVSLPTIGARHGWLQTGAAFKSIQRLVFSDLAGQAVATRGGLSALKSDSRAKIEKAFNVIDQLETTIKASGDPMADEYITVLDTLRAQHIIDINVFTEMREISAGKEKKWTANAVDAARIMAHLTEVNNRVLVSLAAYQLERNNGETVEDATEYAGRMVSQTQFNYSSDNKPPLFQQGGPLGAAAPLMFQFMQWPQHMYAHLIRNYKGMVDAGVLNKSEARSALLGLLGTHAAVGGMVGMTLQPIKWAVGLVMMALGDEDEPYTFSGAISGRTYDQMLTSAAADVFGTDVAAVISKGLPMALGVDLSARMSMGTLYFVDMRGDTAESNLGSLVASFGGATLNQALKFAQGGQKIMRGDVYRGIETMMPKITRDAMRSVRYYNDGLVNNAGDAVIPASEIGINDVVAQFFGFQPAQVSQHYAAQSAIKGAETYARGRKDDLLRRFRTAEGNERRAVMLEIREFNRANRGERITRSALIRNAESKRRRELRYRRYGANVDEKKARQYARYGDPYREE